jgi:hypothetical protein
MHFSYKACLAEEPCTIAITAQENDAGTFYRVEKDGEFLVYLKKEEGLWMIEGDERPLWLTSDDIEGIGDEIENYLQKSRT